MYEREERAERTGMVWIKTGHVPGQPNVEKGYWISKNLAAARAAAGDSVKISNTCDCCKRIPTAQRKTTKSDINKWGICSTCVTLWVDGDPDLQNLPAGELLPAVKEKRETTRAWILSKEPFIRDQLLKRFELERQEHASDNFTSSRG